MKHQPEGFLSIVIPLYNEAAGLPAFHINLMAAIRQAVGEKYEVIYCDDGSSDDTATVVESLVSHDAKVRLISFSRNFGKESALAAGIAQAKGTAILMLDGDGQHPVGLIPRFVEAWRGGAQVVVGVITKPAHETRIKKIGSRLFYRLFNRLSATELVPGSTDYRLIDRAVQQAFLELHETDSITRGLIDWLGFDREYISFAANPRAAGVAGYSHRKLFALATNSFVSLTTLPLYLFGYLGVGITSASLALGTLVIAEQLLLGDPLHWKFTGTAMLSILLIFLVGLVLLSQGILALYISHIHTQSKRRPLYVIDHQKSAGL